MAKPEIITVRDGGGLIGFVAIDSEVCGKASGGLRMHAEVSEDELSLLARTMTLKYGFLGMPKGGAKGGIRFDPEGDPDEMRAILGRFGRAIAPLIVSGRYVPGPDMGVGDGSLLHLMACSGVPFRAESPWRFQAQGDFTAAGVVESFDRALGWLGVPAAGRTASIEGVGAVGLNVVRRLARLGTRVTAVATRRGAIRVKDGLDPEQWASFVQKHGESALHSYPGAEAIDRAGFLGQRVSAFIPCAHHHTVAAGDVAALGSKLIVAGANNPLSNDARKAAELIGIVVLPEFITNAGGVLGHSVVAAWSSGESPQPFGLS